MQLRYDEVRDVELSRTRQRRHTLQQLALGDVQEMNFAAYASADWALSDRWNLNAGLRFDQVHFSYADQLDTIET